VRFKSKKVGLVQQQKQESIMNENERILRQKASAMNSTRVFSPMNSSKKFLSPETKIRQLHRLKNNNKDNGDDLYSIEV